MEVYRDIKEIQEIRNAVLTIGSFDGVHKGHQKILQSLITTAKDIAGESVVLTFHPHPRQVLSRGKEAALKLINSPQEKIELLEKTGIDHLVIIPFTQDFAKLSPREYMEDFLVRYFHPSLLIIGYDHQFGKDRKGNFDSLQRYAEETGAFRLKEIPAQDISDVTVSSTKIRNAIAEGNIEHANNLLGYIFTLKGKVVNGERVGRSIGFPTANVVPVFRDKILPGPGIYTAKVKVEGNEFNAMMYIGLRPTINITTEPVIEVNLFDFSGDIYGKELEISIYSRIRGDKKFDTLEALRLQLIKDREQSLNFFESQKNPGNAR